MRHSPLTGLAVVLGVLALATVLGLWRRRRDGRIRPVPGTPTAAVGAAAPSSVLATLGVRAGAVNLVQFSSPFCAPCRTTRRVLGEIEGHIEGVHLVEVDVEQHLDAVRELDIWRTPTVLVVDAGGRVVQRASGVPGRDDLIAAIRPLLVGAPS
ncbi:thioredoxin family protein [Micromonospora sp. CPCC 206060]|uniref:TlpA family protein disulfide reductase n=1 Tax=Micromonospora sp. CPCC 206060 TaxID=3122406 RepID=UPI002FEEAE19